MFLNEVLLFLLISHAIAAHVNTGEERILDIAVIGAGHSGLSSAKHALDYGYKVTVYEQTEEIGGVWYYTNETGKDKYGVNIHTAMYEGLRINPPYQIMEFPDLPYPNNTISFPSQADVLNYLHLYAKMFNLKRYIKFSHLVIRVQPIENNKWEVIVKNLPENRFETKIFDSIFVCNGHYSKPFIPEIPGFNNFKGQIIHSHDFRTAKAYYNKTVLVIGAGNSGKDIVQHLSKTAKRIIFSQHKRANETDEEHDHRMSCYTKIATLQDNVERFFSNGATFVDGAHHTFDSLILATGYSYSFPFLSVDSGIHFENKFVRPLYRQILNIEYPTMAFITALSNTAIPMNDLQVRYALKFISEKKKLPPKSVMLKDVNNKVGVEDLIKYGKLLSDEADIENIPQVLHEIFVDTVKAMEREPITFRNYKYTIIDDKTFEKENYD